MGHVRWLGPPTRAELAANALAQGGVRVNGVWDLVSFVTSATGPLVIGGTTTTSTLTLRSTSGVGTTGADIVFQVGNNGATEAMRILNSGLVGIGKSPAVELDVTGTISSSAGYGFNGLTAASQGMNASGSTLNLNTGGDGASTLARVRGNDGVFAVLQSGGWSNSAIVTVSATAQTISAGLCT